MDVLYAERWTFGTTARSDRVDVMRIVPCCGVNATGAVSYRGNMSADATRPERG
jgi:hypothetical protein